MRPRLKVEDFALRLLATELGEMRRAAANRAQEVAHLRRRVSALHGQLTRLRRLRNAVR